MFDFLLKLKFDTKWLDIQKPLFLHEILMFCFSKFRCIYRLIGFFMFCSVSKSTTKMIKLRLETIKKKRNAMEKYLKNDVADLLKNGLDENAYGRVITSTVILPFPLFLLNDLRINFFVAKPEN